MIGEDEKQDRRILHEPSVVNYAKQSNRCRHHDVVAIPTSDEFFDPTRNMRAIGTIATSAMWKAYMSKSGQIEAEHVHTVLQR